MAERKRANASGRSRRRPKLGQNFLVDGSAAARIVAALGDVRQSTVVEIGPGHGALTDILAEQAHRLVAIELDRILCAQLRMRYARKENVEIVEGNVLAIQLPTLIGLLPADLAGQRRKPREKALVVGNLPYYITSPVLSRLFSFAEYIDRIVVLVQKEVAERIVARPESRAYGLLSATAQLYARVEKLFTLPPGVFSPPPKVHSTALRLTIEPRGQALGVAEDEFVRFLALCFGQKRKTLVNNLKAAFGADAAAGALEAAGVPRNARAEALTLRDTARVFRALRAAREGSNR